MFLVIQVSGIIASYFALTLLLPWFFHEKPQLVPKGALRSILIIVAVLVLALIATFTIPDPFWANRILHTFAGGFVETLIVYRVLHDTNLSLDWMRFCIVAFAVVTVLGVGNELFECIFQVVGVFVFSDTFTDTWFDLASNTVGILIALSLCAPLQARK